MKQASVWGMIDARPICFPAAVQEYNGALLEFSAPVEAARRLIEGDAFVPVESPPGTAHVSLAAHEVVRGDWGPVTAISLSLRARPVGAPDSATGIYMCRSPVNEKFVHEAAYRSVGVGASLEGVTAHYSDGHVEFRVGDGARPAALLRLPRVRAPHSATPLMVKAYATIADKPYSVPFEFDVPGAFIDPKEVELELGSGWFPDLLRDLGLPCVADMCAWGEGMSATWHTPEPLTGD